MGAWTLSSLSLTRDGSTLTLLPSNLCHPTSLAAPEVQSLHGAAQLVSSDVGVALRGVQVLVPEQLGATQAAVGQEGQEQPVALGLAGMHSAPDAVAARHLEQTPKLSAIEDVRERLALLGCAQHVRGIALEILALHAETEEAAHRRDRARLARRRRAV